MDEHTIAIGQLSRRTGLAASALRYYEELGLLRPAKRVSGRRFYDPAAVDVIGVVLFLRDLGFTLKEIRRVMSPRSRAPKAWRELATRKLGDLDRQIAEAQAAKVAIEHSLACPRENILECPNFWAVVGGLLAGRTLQQAHTR